MPTGGGALGQALSSLRGLPGGQELARTVLADSRLVGDALAARLQSVAADARGGRTPATRRPMPGAAGPPTPAAAIARDGAEILRTPTSAVTSGFGWRQDPFSGATRFHRGVDLRAAAGDHVTSTGAGRVVFSGTDGGYGTTRRRGARQRAEHALRASPLHPGAPRRRDRRGPDGRPGRADRSGATGAPCALRGRGLRPGRRSAAVSQVGTAWTEVRPLHVSKGFRAICRLWV